MRDLSLKARLYILGTIVAGIAILVLKLWAGLPDDLLLLGVTAVVASVAQVYKAEGATETSSYNLSLVVYSFALFSQGLTAALVVALVACVAEWAWYRIPWYIQSFNIGAVTLALSAGSIAFEGVGRARDVTDFHQLVAVLLGTVAFTTVNHIFVGIVIGLARGENFGESGVFSRFTMVMDTTLFVMGGVAALLFSVNPYVAPLAIIPLYLIHTTLQVPALQRQAVTDSKTGLFNARYFNESLQKELERADRFDRPLTVIMGDLDLLRNINNTYGHLAGDVVLVGVADIIKDSVRDYDVVARFGGEEYAILMPETTLEQALPRMEAIRETIEAAEFEVPTSVAPIRATMSFGVATRHRIGLTANEIVHEADLAVYRAKLSGRNRICLLSDREEHGFGDAGDAAESVRVDPVPPEEAVILSGHRDQPTGPAAADTPDHAPPGSDGATARRPMQGHSDAHPAWAVHAYVYGMVAAAAGAFVLLPLHAPTAADWVGLLTVALVASLAELLAIEIYAKDASVSTSAAPYLAGVLLFGAAGALVLAVVIAASAMIKHRSPVSRLAFNSSVHLLAGAAFLFITAQIPGSLDSWPPWQQALATLLGSLILYLITTVAVAGALTLTTGEGLGKIWNDRFRWLAPYYLGFGLVGYAILFSYLNAGAQGIFVVLVPLLLLRLGQKQYIDRTRSIVAQLRRVNAELKKRGGEISEMSEELMIVLSKAVDLRDPYTAGHSEQVSRYASLIAQELGLPEERIDLMRKAALLHDIGKLGIPEAILRKPGRLTSAEYDHVKQHSEWGAHLLSESQAMRRLVPLLRHHHEHYAGDGYPNDLSGHRIPLEARILAVADAIDAMASDRSYRAGLSGEQVVRELLDQSGHQFDPTVVAAFHRIVEREGCGIMVNSAQAVRARRERSQSEEPDYADPSRVVELFPLSRSSTGI